MIPFICLIKAQSPEIPFVLKPNLANARAHGNIRINTDELGLRSLTPGARIPPKGPHEYRLAFVGDSVTFGVGVATADTYPEVVQATLNRLQHRCPVKVFNFAVSSYSVKEMTATLQYRVPAVHPDLVVMGIIINDFDTGRTPGVDAWGYNTHGGASDLVNRYPRVKFFLRQLHLSYVIRDVLSRTLQPPKIEAELRHGKLPEWISSSYGYVTEFKRIARESWLSISDCDPPHLGRGWQPISGDYPPLPARRPGLFRYLQPRPGLYRPGIPGQPLRFPSLGPGAPADRGEVERLYLGELPE